MEKKLKILLVDDMNTMRTIIRKYLEKAGHEVFEAKNGKEALKAMLIYEQIDVILLDYMMPELDGPGFLDKFQAFKGDSKTKVCMMTALENPNDIKKCLEKGADDYLVKPVDQTSLNEKLKLLTEGFSNEAFAQIKCELSATITKPENLNITIKFISEAQVIFVAEKNCNLGSQIEIESKYLNMILGGKVTLFLRIFSTERDGKNFKMKASFVGLKEDLAKRIRSIAIKGEEIHE